MHPATEFKCDELLENPMMKTPRPETPEPRPPRVRKPREFKIPPRFPLVSVQFYNVWVNHIKELQMAKAKVDDKPPQLFPELYLKPRRLDAYAKKLEHNMKVNKELLKNINTIQRTGGYVDCWNKMPACKYNELLCKFRQRGLNEIRVKNLHIYNRLLNAQSEQPCTAELNAMWEHTKYKLTMSSALPFILFKQGSIDKGIKDPAMDKPSPTFFRPKAVLEVYVRGGAKIGRVGIELFQDIVPKSVALFLSLIKGDPHGHAYTGTRIFRIVPNLYCCCGDVTKDNGYGCYLPDGQVIPIGAENFKLKHSVPGVISMVVTKDNELCSQFNIIFKPLPQFDEKHVVIGRIVSGPANFLDRIDVLGLPLGQPCQEVYIRECGYYDEHNNYHEGQPSTIKFPPRRVKQAKDETSTIGGDKQKSE